MIRNIFGALVSSASLLVCAVVWAGAGQSIEADKTSAAKQDTGSPAAARGTIDGVAWLQGCWELSSGNRIVEEQWTRPRGGIMLGVGRTTRDGRLVEYESVVLREQEGRLAYEAHPSGQKSAVFLSREISDTRVVFEDPTHDFPQRVGYERHGSDALSAWVEGSMQGQSRRIDFPYRRVSCP